MIPESFSYAIFCEYLGLWFQVIIK